ncbi:putative membrane protein [Clostridium bornimense]|uniref:Putative membrane protein n=1 Tax=Clostridium bornimense TaxID=1216932 RepID=W6SF63_9CLOT|nr:hypothetical protein [Clostridium bornimense]CDM68350.1 putative membrane protein [Clostridium bornimense]
MFSTILQIVAIILLSVVGRNIIRIFFYEKLSKINKWIFLVLGVVIVLLPFVGGWNFKSFASLIVLSLGVISLILFFDRLGILGDKLIAEEKEEKKVIKPKAKPNRVKNMSEEEKKNQLLK